MAVLVAESMIRPEICIGVFSGSRQEVRQYRKAAAYAIFMVERYVERPYGRSSYQKDLNVVALGYSMLHLKRGSFEEQGMGIISIMCHLGQVNCLPCLNVHVRVV